MIDDHPLVTRGLYRQTGSTFTLLRASAPLRGSTTVKVDPTHPGVLYVNDFGKGIWRSLDDGATWTQIKPPLVDNLSTDRAEFDVTTLSDGHTRMYVGIGNQQFVVPDNDQDPTNNVVIRARVYRTDDASGAAVFTDLTTPQNIDYCTGQCWYDNVAYAASEKPRHRLSRRIVSAASYTRCRTAAPGCWRDRRRNLERSDPGRRSVRAEVIHPDQHAIVTVPGKPLRIHHRFRRRCRPPDGQFTDVSAKCDTRGMNAANTAYCKSLLNRAFRTNW